MRDHAPSMFFVSVRPPRGWIDAKAGSAVRINVTDGEKPGSDVTINVKKEDTAIAYSGDTLVTTSGTQNTSTADVKLAGVVTEATDGNVDDKLNTTQLKFTVYKCTDTATTSPVTSCTSGVTVTRPEAGAASSTVSLTADNYTVKIELLTNGYYTSPVEDQAGPSSTRALASLRAVAGSTSRTSRAAATSASH